VLAALTVEHGLVLANTILTWRAVHAARAFKRPCVWWIHESQFGQQLVTTKRQVADAFTVVDKIVFPTKATADLYTGFCTPNNAVCFHYGLDVPTPGVLPHGFEKKPGKFYVVNIASVERRKGQDVLLESIAMLPNDIRSQFEVFLVGRVLEQAYYRALAKRFKDPKNVHFIGEVDHPTALAYLQAADVYALPSRDEVLPIIMLEAMALGKGIVASRVGGIAEVIEHGINGQLVEPANARTLAQSLELLYNNREYLAQLGCRAQVTYTERLTLTHSGQEFIRLLTGLADQTEIENAGQ
jgi:glycosyltransferase involved in cell wall biosynthesis